MKTNNEKLYSRVFTEISDVYHKSHNEKLQKILGLLEPCNKVLDIGCGDGWFAKGIKNKTKAEVHGIDISKKALAKAKKEGIIAKHFDVDGKKLPYNNNYFDAVICGDLIEHIYYNELLVKEIHRVLKKKGILLISVPNISAYYNRLLLLFGKFPLWIESASEMVFVPVTSEYAYNTGHVRAYNKNTIKKLLEHHGLKVEQIKGVPLLAQKSEKPNKYDKYVGVLNKIEKLFARSSSLSSLILVKARKY